MNKKRTPEKIRGRKVVSSDPSNRVGRPADRAHASRPADHDPSGSSQQRSEPAPPAPDPPKPDPPRPEPTPEPLPPIDEEGVDPDPDRDDDEDDDRDRDSDEDMDPGRDTPSGGGFRARRWVPAVLLLLGLAVPTAPLEAQTRGRLGYDTATDAGFLTVWGTNGERLGRLWVGVNDAAGQLRIYDDGDTRAKLEADGASQGRLTLYGSEGLKAARLTVSDGTDAGSLSIYDDDGDEHARLDIDSVEQGRLTLYGSEGLKAVRLTVDDAHDNGALWLYHANGDKRASLSVDGSGQGLLALDGGDDVERARLSLYDDDNSAFLRLKGASGTTIVQADRSSTGAADSGRLRVYADGAVRAMLGADAGTGGGQLVLRDSTGAATITLDAETGNITKSGSNGFLVPHPEARGKEIFYTSLEGPEAAMYVRGTAALRRGRARVELPEHFAILARAEGITVQLTPNSADTRGLAVVGKSPRGIEVRELAGGGGDFSFDYVVFASRRDVPPIEVVREQSWRAAGPEPVLETLDRRPTGEEPEPDVEPEDVDDRDLDESLAGRHLATLGGVP